uniref:Hexokinase-2 n=1 Tax=Callorhinchus milii TaxID=7868 RepID=A0A4W3HBH5_CALMI
QQNVRIESIFCGGLDCLNSFNISKEKLRDISRRLLLEMEKGLRKETHNDATLKMLPAFVKAKPDGTEKGDFLVIQLSGVNFRTLWVSVNASKKELLLKEEAFTLPKKMLHSSGEEFFDYIADCLAIFMDNQNIKHQILSLGFIFSFPCRQTRIDEGILINWTKDFHVSGVEGKDVVQFLQDAIRRRGDYEIGAVAVLNDTVGTMISCGYEDPNCEIGFIVGPGTSACYMEEMRNVELIEGDEGRMCVNVEWGGFGSDGSLNDIRTEFDLELDSLSLAPGTQIFEKMISHMYLGEIVRLILVKLLNENVLFSGKAKPVLVTRWKFESELVSEIESEKSGLDKVKNILKDFVQDPSELDCTNVQQICRAVFNRTTNICAAGLAAILTRIKKNRNLSRLKISIGVGGTVYREHPKFQKILNAAIKLLTPDVEFKFLLSDDGSSKGAALLTAVATRLAAQRYEINKILNPFKLTHEKLTNLKQRIRKEMEMGLKAETHDKSSIAMLPTFVNHLPNGSEQGNFLALEIGDFIRFLLIKISNPDEREADTISQSYNIPTDVLESTGVQLFDHVVECIADFLRKNKIEGTLPLGFTFSFPCKQTKLDEGFLIKWTKGLKITGCEGKNVVLLLREDIDLEIVAFVNDTVGTMMAGAFKDPKCEIGLVVGTGTNACYMEEMRNIEMVLGDEGRMCINTEWGAFGDNGCLEDIVTSYDKQLDNYSQNPGQQTYEKLISSMYLGEITRTILIDLTEKGILFHGKISEQLNTENIFNEVILAQLERDDIGLLQIRSILQNLGLESTCDDSMIVKEVCLTTSKRAANLCGVGIANVVEKIRENRGLEELKITVGVDGTLYKLHPHFSRVVEETVKTLAPKCVVKFTMIENGSCLGAALVAAVIGVNLPLLFPHVRPDGQTTV